MERPRKSAQITRNTDLSRNGRKSSVAGAVPGGRAGPGGYRALLGGLLVAAAAVIVFAAALSAAGGGRQAYVVAARPIPAGAVIGPGDTTTARLGLSGAAAVRAFRTAGPLIGRSVAVAVLPGELIESSMLAPGRSSQVRPVSIPVDADSLAPLAAGDQVDVLATPSASAASGGSAPASEVTVVMRGATLISVGRSDTGLLSGSGGGTAVVTLGVADLAEAESLIQAAHAGTVELVRAEPSDGTGPGPAAAPQAGG